MRFHLRTLLIVLAVGPILGARGYRVAIYWQAKQEAAAAIKRLREELQRESVHRQPLSLKIYVTPAVAPDRGKP